VQPADEGRAQWLRNLRAHPIATVETEYSLWSRDVENDVLPACRELGIAFMAYAPLGRGFLTATMKTLDALLPKDRRREHPRFNSDNIKRNAELLTPIERVAAARSCMPAQVALAWLLAQKPWIVPIPGTTKLERLDENIGAAQIELTGDDLREIKRAASEIEVQGARYPEHLEQLTGR